MNLQDIVDDLTRLAGAVEHFALTHPDLRDRPCTIQYTRDRTIRLDFHLGPTYIIG